MSTDVEPQLLSRLEDLYHLEKNSFIRYVVEDSLAELRDDTDRRVFSAYEDWKRESTRSQAALGELLAEHEVTPDESSYPIDFSQFNYLSPTYLLRQVISKMEAHIALFEEKGKGLAAWPRARDLVRSIVDRARLHLEKVRRLEAELPKEPPRPARIKGTSASRW